MGTTEEDAAAENGEGAQASAVGSFSVSNRSLRVRDFGLVPDDIVDIDDNALASHAIADSDHPAEEVPCRLCREANELSQSGDLMLQDCNPSDLRALPDLPGQGDVNSGLLDQVAKKMSLNTNAVTTSNVFELRHWPLNLPPHHA